MKNTNEIIQEKRVYISPQIERIQLDNEISLIMNSLSSAPPAEPE